MLAGAVLTTLIPARLLVAQQFTGRPETMSGRDRSDAPGAPPRSRSLVLGGMIVGTSRLALVKGELARGKWALVSDLTRDDTRESWDATITRAASRDEYVLWASSSALRRYTRPGGRGFYVEAGAGMSQLSLRSRTEEGATTRRKASLALATWGVGTRVAVRADRAFVELAFRSAVPLQTRHLHAADEPPAGSTSTRVSYQSWYLGRGKSTGQFFVALGLRL
jgi:hypothetical protein